MSCPATRNIARWGREMQHRFGLPILSVICIVYFTQGIRSTLTSLGTSYYLKETLQLNPAKAEALRAIAGFPWVIKPLYGVFSDGVPIFGEHRRPYLILFGFLAMTSYLCLSFPGVIQTYSSACMALLSASFSIAVCDVVIDASVVELSRKETIDSFGNLQSLSWISLSIGSVFGSLISGTLLSMFNIHIVFLLSSVGPLLTVLFSYYATVEMPTNVHVMEKKPVSFFHTIYSQSVTIVAVLRRPHVYRPVLWIFLSNAMSPNLGEALFNFKTSRLEFTKYFLGFVSFVGSVTLLLSTVAYNAWFKRSSFRYFLTRIQLISGMIAFSELIFVARWNVKIGLSDRLFVLSDEVLNDVASRLKHMPTLVLCAQICPIGVEGTLFALLMSLHNFSWTISSLFGSYICRVFSISPSNFDGLFLAIVIRTIMKFAPLALVFMLPNQIHIEKEQEENAVKSESKEQTALEEGETEKQKREEISRE